MINIGDWRLLSAVAFIGVSAISFAWDGYKMRGRRDHFMLLAQSNKRWSLYWRDELSQVLAQHEQERADRKRRASHARQAQIAQQRALREATTLRLKEGR